MSKEHWVLPQGIEEALPEQAARLEILRRDLLDCYASWGYQLVMPPFIDHVESLLTGAGRDLDLQTFKLVDQVSGRTLGVRADMTPQVARIDAHQLNTDAPTRLCYIGTVLRTQADSFGSSRSPLQVGAELYGHAGVESDVEIIRLMLATFDVAGVNDVYLDLGNVDIFRNLIKQAGLNAEHEHQLFDLMQRKAIPEIEQLLDTLKLEKSLSTMLVALTELNGDASVLKQARGVLAKANTAVLDAVDYLEKTAEKIAERFDTSRLRFDLGESHGYHYQTGVVFEVFAPKLGQAIARGGRYDDIGEVFGRARAATGFSTDLKILNALSSRKFSQQQRVLAPAGNDEVLLEKIKELRSQGVCVIEQLPGQSADAADMECSHTLVQVDGRWQLSD